MKTTIIGAGIGGLALGILLKNKGLEYAIYEKTSHRPRRGHSFLIGKEGMDILKRILPADLVETINPIYMKELEIRNTQDELMEVVSLDGWACVRRKELIKALWNQQDEHSFYLNRELSGFEYENGLAKKAIFSNGERVSSDYFIGADGAHSAVRKELFEDTSFTPVEYREIIGRINDPELVKRVRNKFLKYTAGHLPLNFSIIHTSDSEIVWVAQVDASFIENCLLPGCLRHKCQTLYQDFPEIVREVIEKADFELTYLWNATDFDLLPAFHKSNVGVIGDAAHMSLPFTSAGITSALKDAEMLANMLDNDRNFHQAFEQLYLRRRDEVAEHINFGRKLKDEFLGEVAPEARMVPLFSHQNYRKVISVPQRVIFKIFTDPVCSTCWFNSADLKKFLMVYKDDIQVTNIMGGLLPSWTNYNRGPIKEPNDVYLNWRNNSNMGMRIFGDIWINDPVKSSFPASVLFKAVTLAAPEKATIFYRYLQESLFLQNENIGLNEKLIKLAQKCGISKKAINQVLNQAFLAFEQDLHMVEKNDVKVLPTYIFRSCSSEVKIKGIQRFADFESALLEANPHIAKRPSKIDPIEVIKNYESLTTHELKVITEMSTEELEEFLIKALKENEITYVQHHGTLIWRNSEKLLTAV